MLRTGIIPSQHCHDSRCCPIFRTAFWYRVINWSPYRTNTCWYSQGDLSRGRGQVTGITFTETKFLVGQIAKHGVKGIRDAALFSLMSDCMLRESELVAVRPADLEMTSDGSGRLHLPKSKTDQEGAGATLYVGAPTMERIHSWLH